MTTVSGVRNSCETFAMKSRRMVSSFSSWLMSRDTIIFCPSPNGTACTSSVRPGRRPERRTTGSASFRVLSRRTNSGSRTRVVIGAPWSCEPSRLKCCPAVVLIHSIRSLAERYITPSGIASLASRKRSSATESCSRASSPRRARRARPANAYCQVPVPCGGGVPTGFCVHAARRQRLRTWCIYSSSTLPLIVSSPASGPATSPTASAARAMSASVPAATLQT